MTLKELIGAYRALSGDRVLPPLVSDPLATIFANEGETEACRRCDLLVESLAPMCSVPVSAGDPMVKLDNRITRIKRARMSAGADQLLPVRVCDLDAHSAQWESESGTPSHYATDYQAGHLRLYPSPAATDTLLLTVCRLPEKPMEDDEFDEPEIRPETHMSLVQWMLYRAYSIQDSDLFDAKRAASALAEFEREFGIKRSARNEEWMRVHDHDIYAQPIA